MLQSYHNLLKKWSVVIQEIDVQTTYGVTHCILAGSPLNPPLLLFHGVGDNSAVMWMLNMKELSKYYYCIAIDTIGGPGKSVTNKNFKRKLFDQVTWINELADKLNLQVFNIAGVSNGAYIAFNYAINESEKVNKVVCMEGGMITKPIKSMLNALLMMFPEIIVPTRNNMYKILRKLSSPKSYVFDKHPELADHLILLMKYHNQQAMFVHKLQKYDQERAISMKEKFYFLIGEYKLKQKKDFIRTLEDGGFRYRIIADAGHGINHEQPEVLNHEIISFLSGGEDL